MLGYSTGFMVDARRQWPALVDRAASFSRLAVELSALSLSELPGLVRFLGDLGRLPFEFTSVHAPSKGLHEIDDAELVSILTGLPPWVDAVVIHPDTIREPREFRRLGRLLTIENMDARKPTGRTADELEPLFAELPEAGLCFDIAHAKDVDPEMIVGEAIMDRFGHRLRHVHLSSLGAKSGHVPLTAEDEQLFQPLLSRCRDVPWVLEAAIRDR